MNLLKNLQAIGRALMMPIAVLPVAALLLRLGQPDLLDIPFISAAGSAIFDNIGLLFAAGVALGLAHDNHGAAALAGIVCYLVATSGMGEMVDVTAAMPAELGAHTDQLRAFYQAQAVARLAVPLGILSGLIAGLVYNRFGRVQLPEFLAFFGGRRLVPILCGFCGIALALVFGTGFEFVSRGMDSLSSGIAQSGHIGLFLYGILNRLLIITGLHHILNNIAWFSVGEFEGKTGDLVRFFAGDPSAGGFMTGFYPVMMFGLPGACLAMYHSIPRQRRRASAGMFTSIALTALLTGVTEPIEFSFMFVAPLLYVLHALLTGISMFLTDLLGIKAGFGFSAGLIDYLINYRLITQPLLLLIVGAGYGLLYYAVFRIAIAKFNLNTPGRQADTIEQERTAPATPDALARDYLRALGGPGNVVTADACTTRLRLTVKSTDILDRERLRQLGAKGVICPSRDTVQVVVGPAAELLANGIKQDLSINPEPEPESPAQPRPIDVAALDIEGFTWLQPIGGKQNIESLARCGNRLRITLVDASRVEPVAADSTDQRGILLSEGGTLHILLSPADIQRVFRR